eukprot:751368-Hanusia_phi.AAC.2
MDSGAPVPCSMKKLIPAPEIGGDEISPSSPICFGGCSLKGGRGPLPQWGGGGVCLWPTGGNGAPEEKLWGGRAAGFPGKRVVHMLWVM